MNMMTNLKTTLAGIFVAGMLLIKIFENPRLVAKRNAIRDQRHWMATA